MKTDALIRELASQAQPVQPLAHPFRRFAYWFFLALLYVAIGVLIIGFRKDLSDAITKTSFLIQAVVLLTLSFTTSLSAFYLSIPDLRNQRIMLTAVLVLAVWLVVFSAPILLTGDVTVGEGLRCLRNVLFLGLPPSALLYLILIKAFPLRKAELIFIGLVSTFGLGCFGTRFICPNDDPLHFFAWHCLPVLLVSVAGFGLARFISCKQSL